jgi:lipoprotein-releasing system ATP-binding protein
MFERYTEKARRVIFFARLQASEFGSWEIRTEHLLLGLIQENQPMLARLLASSAAVESIRKSAREKAVTAEKISASIDLPLTEESKRVLRHAADEAERWRHRRIGAKHLLLGILREEQCLAARILREHGLDLEGARQLLWKSASEEPDREFTQNFEENRLSAADDTSTPTEVAAEPGSGAEPVVRVVNLTKTFSGVRGPLEILKGVDLTIYQGEIVAIVGQSGSGKSTLLHLLGAIDRPTSGSVYFGTQDPFALSAEQLAKFRRQSVGFVFQFHNLLPEFTALENVMMPRLIAGNHSDDSRGVELLELVGLGDRLTHRPGELSGGEQQRVAIARALVNNPALLLADEPTGALDNQTGESVFNLFRKIQSEKKLTSILATHNVNIAKRCNRLFRLENGWLQEIHRYV